MDAQYSGVGVQDRPVQLKWDDTMAFQDDDDQVYTVLINDELQYSLWPKRITPPLGWTECGFEGKKSECSRYVDEHWIDMRPLSLRKAMAD